MSRPATTDALVMREVRRFMATTAEELVQLLDSARTLRRKLERTAEYRRAMSLSRAGRESESNAVPAHDLAGTLKVMFEEDLENMVEYLRDGARRTSRAAARAWPERPEVCAAVAGVRAGHCRRTRPCGCNWRGSLGHAFGSAAA